MMARNRNLLARKTVHTLELLTSDNSKPFVIPTMVDRMSAMLNYVLQLLVGPKSKELKVRIGLVTGQTLSIIHLALLPG